MLQIVNGSQMMSFLDGFFGNNQVMVDKEDRLKTTFTMKWGTFTYRRISFALINIGDTFEREMDITFKDLTVKCIIIYMDDLTVFFKDRSSHVQDLRKVL